MSCTIYDSPLPLRGFSSQHISEYMLKINELNEDHGTCSTLKCHIAGIKMFQSNFINSVTFKENIPDGTLELFGTVRAEYKKTGYNVEISIDMNSNEILGAKCKCPGDTTPSSCKHAFAVLAFIQEYYAKELFNAPTEILQEWHKPSKKKKFPPQRIVDIVKNCTTKPANFNSQLNFDALSLLKRSSPLFSVLVDKRFNVENCLLKNSICLPVSPSDQDSVMNDNNEFELSLDEILFLHANVKISLQEAQDIEKRMTKQQNDIWKKQRKLRVTASNFFEVVHRKNCLDVLSLRILEDRSLDHIPAVRHGKRYERKVKNYIEEKYSTYNFRDVGLVINPRFYYLGASPDGLLHENDKDSFLIEIKCVYNTENLDLEELCTKPGFCLEKINNVFHLKKNHKHFYQVQGQMAVSNIKKCLFVLLYDVQKEPFIEEIVYEVEKWTSMHEKLHKFYFSVHLKNILKSASS